MHVLTAPSTITALADVIRRNILDLTLKPGSRVREADLVQAYGVARHTARAAISALAADGLLRHTPNKGAHVPELDADDVVDVFRLRAAIETEAIRQVIGRQAEPVATQRASEILDTLPDNAGWDQIVAADMAFHSSVISDSNSPRLERAFATAKAEIELCMSQLRPHYDRASQVAEEHRILLAALCQPDLAAGIGAFRQHWDEAVTRLLASLSARQE